MHKYSRIFFIILVFFASNQLSSQQTMVEVDRIIETNLNQTVPIIGTIISNKKSNLMAPLPGKVDSILFEEGDFGDSMYIVANGKVRVHKGERTIVELEKGACVGEMALLDQEPRSADVTVNADTTLLKITQDGFYELMGSNMEIMHGIVKLNGENIKSWAFGISFIFI